MYDESKFKISPSKLDLFLACRNKYKYAYEEELIPALPPSTNALSLGSLVHQFFAVGYETIAEMDHFDLDAILRNLSIEAAALIETSPDSDAVMWAQELVDDFFYRFYPTEDQACRVIAVEEEIFFDMGDFVLHCIIDLILQDQLGRYTIIDHKSHQNNSWDAKKVRLNHQFPLYAYAAEKSGLLEKAPDFLAVNQINTYKYKKTPSLNQRFSRVRVPLVKAQQENHIRELREIVSEITKPNSPRYRTTARHCGYCNYADLCEADFRNKRSEIIHLYGHKNSETEEYKEFELDVSHLSFD